MNRQYRRHGSNPQRGTGMIFCLGIVTVFAILVYSQASAFTQARLAQRRAEVARAERLLEANARVVIEALAKGMDPQHPLLTAPQGIEIAFDDPDTQSRGTLTARGGHPAACVALQFEIDRGEASEAPTVVVSRIPTPATD